IVTLRRCLVLLCFPSWVRAPRPTRFPYTTLFRARSATAAWLTAALGQEPATGARPSRNRTSRTAGRQTANRWPAGWTACPSAPDRRRYASAAAGPAGRHHAAAPPVDVRRFASSY